MMILMYLLTYPLKKFYFPLNLSKENHVCLFHAGNTHINNVLLYRFQFYCLHLKDIGRVVWFCLEPKNRCTLMVLFVFKSLVRRERMKFTMSIASWLIYLYPVSRKSSFKWNYSDKFLSSLNKQKMFQGNREASSIFFININSPCRKFWS